MSVARAVRAVRARARRDERGVAVILLVSILLGGLAMMALVVDIGNAQQRRRQAQNAADAAALAAANSIAQGATSATAVVATIKDYVTRNMGAAAWSTCVDANALAVKPDIGSGNGCISWDANPPATTRVRVSLPRYAVGTYFGKAVAHVDTLWVRGSATASISGGAGGACALCVLGPDKSELQNGNVEVTGGAIQVGTPLLCNGGRMTTFGSPQPPILIRAGGSASCGGSFSPTPDWNGATVADPLAYLPAHPDYSTLSAKSDCSSGAIGPGVYKIIGNCSLSAGLYVVTGVLSGGSTAPSGGVTVFFACGTTTALRACVPGGEAGGTISTSGSGSVDLRAATCTSGPCTGGSTPRLAIWFDRHNTAVLKMNGNGLVTIVGTIYAPAATLDFRGTPSGTAGVCDSTSQSLCSRTVIGKLGFSGQGKLQLKFVTSLNIVAKRSPALVA